MTPREALEKCRQMVVDHETHSFDDYVKKYGASNPREAILSFAATLPAEAPQPATQRSEPVAWRWKWKHHGDWRHTGAQPRGGDAIDVEPLYAAPLSETPAGGTAKALIAPRGHDEAHERINECFREIEIICDTFGYDPAQWLVIDDGDMASPQSGNEEKGK